MKYMLCTDGSDSAGRALNRLLALATKEDQIHIFCSFSYPILDPFQQISAPSAAMFSTSSEYEAYIRQCKKNCEGILDEYREILKEKGFDRNVQFSSTGANDVREAIVEFADKNSIDIIIVGTRGLGKLSRIFLGSVSSYVVQNAHCDVLVVR